jgi:hypothetical protein
MYDSGMRKIVPELRNNGLKQISLAKISAKDTFFQYFSIRSNVSKTIFVPSL